MLLLAYFLVVFDVGISEVKPILNVVYVVLVVLVFD